MQFGDTADYKSALLPRVHPETGQGQKVFSQGDVAALALDGPEQNVTVAAADDGEIGAGFKLVVGAHPVRDDELVSNRKGRCHIVGKILLRWRRRQVERTD